MKFSNMESSKQRFNEFWLVSKQFLNGEVRGDNDDIVLKRDSSSLDLSCAWVSICPNF